MELLVFSPVFFCLASHSSHPSLQIFLLCSGTRLWPIRFLSSKDIFGRVALFLHRETLTRPPQVPLIWIAARGIAFDISSRPFYFVVV
ncbi:uncharacterized protein BYT42DRAFT_567149, partial [Radiomyces spectabilis]|uniref:uncharacterized protein n=1 Tax=Radiomyces spectabilis TaxID=64574 RepID=UPI00221E9F90